ncbi:MAG: hypothetical protein AAF587_04255 [Bacteroidota bacterium]
MNRIDCRVEEMIKAGFREVMTSTLANEPLEFFFVKTMSGTEML